MHPTDFCHPNETACARTSCVPGSLSPLSRRGCPTESLAPYGVTGGQDVSRRPGPLRRIDIDTDLRASASRLGHEAWAFSSHGVDAIEPLTSLSRFLVHPRASPVFTGAASSPSPPAFDGRLRVGGCERVPRPPVSAARERQRFVMIQDAFHQQGPFVGSGGLYDPGPATAAPLARCLRRWWRSRATLGLAPILARHSGEADSRLSLRLMRRPTV